MSDLGRVVEVLDEKHVVLNVGSNYGAVLGSRIVIFGKNREIKDIDGKSLGELEVVKGYGKLIHVQEKMSIVRADEGDRGFKADALYVGAEANAFAAALAVTRRMVNLKVAIGDYSRPV